MIKPNKLQKGDKVATISLSSGMSGDTLFKHRYEIGKKRLEDIFGLEVIEMKHSLSSTLASAFKSSEFKHLRNSFLSGSKFGVFLLKFSHRQLESKRSIYCGFCCKKMIPC